MTECEKKVLWNIVLGYSSIPKGMGEDDYADCVSGLEEMGLVYAQWEEGHHVVDVRPTPRGRSYAHTNPSMKNPINWAKIAAISTAIGVLISIIALFVACMK